MKHTYAFFTISCLLLFSTSCKKIVQVESDTLVTSEKMFADDQSAETAIIGLYAKLNGSFNLTNGYLSRYLSLYADDLIKSNTSNGSDNAFQTNTVLANDVIIWELYSAAFNHIFHANSVIENVQKSPNLSSLVRQQIEGEAKFLRSLVYFYLVNLFGDVPLVLQTDPEATYKIPRAATQQVYQQIIDDLRAAQTLLPEQYPANPHVPSTRIRANKGAATALLARVYLFTNDYANARQQSSRVLQSGLYSLENCNKAFLAESKETILGLYPTSFVYNTAEGRFFGNNPLVVKPPFLLPTHLVDSFSAIDKRRQSWIRAVVLGNETFYVPDKYKVFESKEVLEYNIVLRLAEVHFIRCEANLRLNNIQQAIEDLNIIRQRAGLPNLSFSLTAAQVLTELEMEKRKEFFTEWGMRWLDIKRWRSRTNDPSKTRADDILPLAKPSGWESFKLLLPIPFDELKNSPVLLQNPGYH